MPPLEQPLRRLGVDVGDLVADVQINWWITTSSSRGNGSSRAGTCNPPRISTTASQAPQRPARQMPSSNVQRRCPDRSGDQDPTDPHPPRSRSLDARARRTCPGVPRCRPLSQSADGIGMPSNVRGDMATGPVGKPARSSPLVVGHQDRVAQQTLRRGPDQRAASELCGRRCGGSHAHTVVPDLRVREVSMPSHFTCAVSAPAHTMCSVTDRLVVRCASTTCRTSHSICRVTR